MLGLIFLKYLSDSFDQFRIQLKQNLQDPHSPIYLDPAYSDDYQTELNAELEDRDHYTAENIVFVPVQARWETLKNCAALQSSFNLPDGTTFHSLNEVIDNSLETIENSNPKLKGALEKIGRYNLSNDSLRGLIITFSDTNFYNPIYQGVEINLSVKDILGHVYEYFLGEFARAEGKRGGEFFTPKSIVGLIVEILQPYSGRIYDPAMGAGGFFVQTEKFIKAHHKNTEQIICYGQEYNPTTWKLATMNMVLRNLSFDFGQRNADTFTNNQHPHLRTDFIMANPPFNVKEWWNDSLTDDPRWQFGTPPEGNANFAWIQHMIYHLSPKVKNRLSVGKWFNVK